MQTLTVDLGERGFSSTSAARLLHSRIPTLKKLLAAFISASVLSKNESSR